THSSIVFLFISSFSKRRKSDDNITFLNGMIGNNILSLHPTSNRRDQNYVTNQIANNCSLATSRICTKAYFKQFSKDIFCTINDFSNYFSWNKVLVSTNGRRQQNLIRSANTK